MSTCYTPFCTASRAVAATSAVAVTCAIFIAVASGMTGDFAAVLAHTAAAAPTAAAPCVPAGKAA